MSTDCTSYYKPEKVFVNGFSCPKQDNDARAVFCCGFNDMKYCCDDPNSFFPYEYGYMWWLSVGALVGLSIAAVVLLAFIITICVLCYLFIATKPSQLDNGLPLQTPGHGDKSVGENAGENGTACVDHIVKGSDRGGMEGPSNANALAGPQGFRKQFLNRKLDCDNKPPDPDRLFQRCFMATVTTVNVEGPS